MQANVLEWLDTTAKLYPDKLAIHDETESYSFKQYRAKAVGIADMLISMNVAVKTPVAVYLEKSARVLVSFMGIAYAGCFYSPIDADMPAQRINKIIEVLQPKTIITTKALEAKLRESSYSGDVILYEDAMPMETSGRVKDVQKRIIDTDLLYVLFTSGSTGMPKGVCISHRSVIDYIDWVTETFQITCEDSFGNQAPFYFDNSILDIYSSVKTGAALYIIPKELFPQPVRLLEFIKEKQINSIFWVPSALMVVSKLKAFKKVDLTETLKRVLFCGEVMPNKQLNIWRKYLPNATYANLYGPTEITDACTCYIVDRQFQDNDSLPIGSPMKNTEILVIDHVGHLITKPGIIGELCVRGTCVAAGYYNNPEKTREVFVQNPLHCFYEDKIYKTGDLVQYNARGELLYISRKDFQIKHLGHRIELGEIETAVSSLPDITMCCCLYDNARSRIVLFLDRDLPIEEIHRQLKTAVPKYMLPGKVIFMDRFPMNANGKVDRVKLKEYL